MWVSFDSFLPLSLHSPNPPDARLRSAYLLNMRFFFSLLHAADAKRDKLLVWLAPERRLLSFHPLTFYGGIFFVIDIKCTHTDSLLPLCV